MQKRISAFALAIMGIVSILIFTGCGGGSGSVTVTGLTFSPTSATVLQGGIAQFTLAVTFNNPTNATGTTPVITYLVNGTAGGNLTTIGSIAFRSSGIPS